jgi:hypothetical protein
VLVHRNVLVLLAEEEEMEVRHIPQHVVEESVEHDVDLTYESVVMVVEELNQLEYQLNEMANLQLQQTLYHFPFFFDSQKITFSFFIINQIPTSIDR